MSRRVSASRSMPWSNLDPDQRNTVLLYGAIGLIILIALAIVGYGYYDQLIAPNHATVLKVGSREFDYDYFKRRVTGAWLQNEISAQDASNDAARLLLSIELEEVTRQVGVREGITVSEDEIQAQILTRLGLKSDAGRDLLGARLRSELLGLDLSYNEYRDIARSEVIETKLKEQIAAAIPAQVEHVNLGLIQTNSREDADAALQRLNNGESFAAVADDVSRQNSKPPGGDMGWTPRGSLLQEIEDAAFALTPGARSDVIEIQGAFFILDSRGREVRDTTDKGKADIIKGKFANLQVATRDAVGSTITLTNGQLSSILSSLPARATS